MLQISGGAFALTGNFTQVVRRKLIAAIESGGGQVHDAVNRFTKTLIVGGGLGGMTNKLRTFRELQARFKPQLIPAAGGYRLAGLARGILKEREFIALASPRLLEVCKIRPRAAKQHLGDFGFDFRVGGQGPIRFGPQRQGGGDIVNFSHYFTPAQVARGQRLAPEARRRLSGGRRKRR